MALDLSSKLDAIKEKLSVIKFSKLSTKMRILIVIMCLVAIVLLMWFVSSHFFAETTGAAELAQAPSAIRTVGGGKETAAFRQARIEADSERRQQALKTGGSAVSSIGRTENMSASGQCNIICSDQAVNVKNTLADWNSRGEISDDLYTHLQDLANKNVSPDEFANELNRLVREGKLTPEQARELLAQYQKQHANRNLLESAALMDKMIKDGTLPLDVANELLAMQKAGVNPKDYAAALDRLVREGKITPEMAQQLLAQYARQYTQGIIDRSIAFVRKLGQEGKLPKDIEEAIVALEKAFGPYEEFALAMKKYADAGTLPPNTVKILLQEYQQQKIDAGSIGGAQSLLDQAYKDAYKELDDLQASGKITKDVADQIRSLIKQDVTFEAFQSSIKQLLEAGKLSPDIAALKIEDYRKIKGLQDLVKQLNGLAANNASPGDYASMLRQAVQNKLLTPDQADKLLRDYTALRGARTQGTGAAFTTNDELARLQQGLTAGAAAAPQAEGQFAEAQEQAVQVSAEQQQANIQAIMAAMSQQASQLITAWQPPTMQVKAGTELIVAREGRERGGKERSGFFGREGAKGPPPPVLIKAGTVVFAVLDTEANSDFPNSPIMATIVQGPLKGAKLLGKLRTQQSIASGQQDRIGLNFTLMNFDAWPRSKGVNAFAIDPDTARSVMASDVNYHYMQRFGAIMATSFLQGYAQAVQTSGSSTSSSVFGTVSSNPQFSPQQKIAIGVGKIGEKLGDVTQKYSDIPPTVVVNAGVSIGILFMTDLS